MAHVAAARAFSQVGPAPTNSDHKGILAIVRGSLYICIVLLLLGPTTPVILGNPEWLRRGICCLMVVRLHYLWGTLNQNQQAPVLQGSSYSSSHYGCGSRLKKSNGSTFLVVVVLVVVVVAVAAIGILKGIQRRNGELLTPR